jgi:ribonucleoside-diphosphate reductase alpha chain
MANEKRSNGLLPTPPLPVNAALVELTDNARQVLMVRYVRRSDDGKPAESIEEMFWRVAYHIARVEETWGQDILTQLAHLHRGRYAPRPACRLFRFANLR